MGVTRRRFLAIGCGLGVGASGAIACAAGGGPRVSSEQAQGRLRARPGRPASSSQPLAPGEQRLKIGTDRDVLLHVPRNRPAAEARLPLLVLLHGATGSAQGITKRIGAAELSDRLGLLVLSPDARDSTWDVINGGFGPDVAVIDAALERLFERTAIDPAHVAVGGFSDGASYALSLGLINGDLFTHVIAFSPGFLVADHRNGRPAIFVSHGTQDEILPIATTSRRLVPALRQAGYAVEYREFDGPHTVPAPIARDAFAWMLDRSASAAPGTAVAPAAPAAPPAPAPPGEGGVPGGR